MSERFDLYASIHKALRNYMGATLLSLGRLDLNDEHEVERSTGALLGLLDWLEQHLRLEEEFVHRALEVRRDDRLLSTLRRDHEQHELGFAALRADAAGLVASRGEPMATRRAGARKLYLAFSRFMADNFVHMAIEEADMNLLLWDTFSDAELLAIYRAVLQSEPAEQLEIGMIWLLPAISPDDRVAVVGGARAILPAPLFAQLSQNLRSALSARDFGKLAHALGLPDAA
ncbi:MAG: hypothetical protein K0R38_6100 [Polyangiaceae bacterium]|jgi:hypothetical protein|nr:hypothetical protein [Polyangiaceae bacterium]